MKRESFSRSGNLWFGLAKIALITLILLIGALIFYLSSKYFNTSYKSGYLSGRAEETVNQVRLALLIHLIAASFLLLATTPFLFFRIERKNPQLHRKIGKSVITIGLLFLIPTSFYLSFQAMGGFIGISLFLSLSIATFFSLFKGYKCAVSQSFHEHRVWMIRFYILLTSALWLRINMFWVFGTFGFGDWQYNFSAFLSWVPQLIIFETFRKKH